MPVSYPRRQTQAQPQAQAPTRPRTQTRTHAPSYHHRQLDAPPPHSIPSASEPRSPPPPPAFHTRTACLLVLTAVQSQDLQVTAARVWGMICGEDMWSACACASMRAHALVAGYRRIVPQAWARSLRSKWRTHAGMRVEALNTTDATDRHSDTHTLTHSQPWVLCHMQEKIAIYSCRLHQLGRPDLSDRTRERLRQPTKHALSCPPGRACSLLPACNPKSNTLNPKP